MKNEYQIHLEITDKVEAALGLKEIIQATPDWDTAYDAIESRIVKAIQEYGETHVPEKFMVDRHYPAEEVDALFFETAQNQNFDNMELIVKFVKEDNSADTIFVLLDKANDKYRAVVEDNETVVFEQPVQSAEEMEAVIENIHQQLCNREELIPLNISDVPKETGKYQIHLNITEELEHALGLNELLRAEPNPDVAYNIIEARILKSIEEYEPAYRITCEVKYTGEQDVSEVYAFALPPEVIQESINQKSYVPVIAHLEQQEQKEIEFFVPLTPLKKAVMENCNIYETKVRLEGTYVSVSEEDREYDPGVLTDVESEGQEGLGDIYYTIQGTYTFEVAAKSEKEALAAAQDVFDEHWNNGYVDCGDIEGIDTLEQNRKFEIVDSYSFENKKAKEQVEMTND